MKTILPRLSALALLLSMLPGCASLYSAVLGDNLKVEPFEMAPNVYYIGGTDIAVFALRSGDELILVDSGYPSTARRALKNLDTLGLGHLKVSYVLITHAHFDHAAGTSEFLKKHPGAKVIASELEAETLKAGIAKDLPVSGLFKYPQIREADVETRADGKSVGIGNLEVTAHLTPGHTAGCTSWSFTVRIGDRNVPALIACSVNSLFFQNLLEANHGTTPAEQFKTTFDKLRTIPCDFFLGDHGMFFHLKQQREKQLDQPGSNPFENPLRCKAFLAEKEAAFLRKLERQSR